MMDDALYRLLPPEARLPHVLPRDERLFVHSTRPHWGIGLWVKEESNRRRLRFQDGEIRAFRKDFWHLFEPVDPEGIDVDAVFEDLAGDHALAEGDRRDLESRTPLAPVMSFQEQITVFRSLYPGGFTGEAWKAAWREGDKRKKTHLGTASRDAQERLGQQRMRAAVDASEFDAVFGDAMDILRSCALVTPSRLVPFAALDAEGRERFVRALDDLLWGTERYAERLTRWLDVLSGVTSVRWPLVSALPALVHPDEHLCVRGHVLSLQGRSVRPDTRVKKVPTRHGYRKARRIARAVRENLVASGNVPADLLDVRTFVWETLRPTGQKHLERLRDT